MMEEAGMTMPRDHAGSRSSAEQSIESLDDSDAAASAACGEVQMLSLRFVERGVERLYMSQLREALAATLACDAPCYLIIALVVYAMLAADIWYTAGGPAPLSAIVALGAWGLAAASIVGALLLGHRGPDWTVGTTAAGLLVLSVPVVTGLLCVGEAGSGQACLAGAARHRR